MAFLWRGYVSLLKRHTLATQMATGGFTSGLGDCIYQQLIDRRGWEGHEMHSTLRLMTYGGIIFAPIANRWHALLSLIVLRNKYTTVIARTLTDAAFFAPSATCIFYLSQGAMEGRPLRSANGVQGIWERLGERLWGTVQKQWSVFVPANLVNLAYIPIYARPPFMNVFACGWSVFLASAQNVGAMGPTKSSHTKHAPSAAVVAAEVYQ